MTLEGGSVRESVSTQRMQGPHGWARKYRVRLFVTDLLVLSVVMVGAHAIRFGWDPFTAVAGKSAPAYWQVTVAVVLLWMLQLTWTRSREARILGHGPQEFQRLLTAAWRTFAVIAIIGFLTQWQISRGYLIFAIPVGTLALAVYREVWRMWMHAQRDHGHLQAQVIIAGPLRTSEQMIRRLRGSRRAGYHVMGVCLPPTSRGELADDVADVPALGSIDEVSEIAIREGAEYILLSGTDAMSLREARRIGWQLEGTDVGLIVAPAMVDVAGPRVTMSPVEGLPLIHVDVAQFEGGRYALKEVLDRLSAALLLAVLAVPMAVVAIGAKVSSPGPALFRQERIGKDGRAFQMLKFRSMVPDAEAHLREVMGEEIRPFYKNEEDPRITPFGRFIRRYSLDELPQIINVLKGDMSLVGPRPQVAAEVETYGDLEKRRLLVKPGMTGLWQVSGRSSLPTEQAIRLDAFYAENWSLAGDLVILAKTLRTVVGSAGAY